MVYVVVLNWNGWRDTVACLESVLRSEHAPFQVVVCDNASTDDSMHRLAEWAAGHAPHGPESEDDPLARLVTPPVPKPTRCAVLSRAEAEVGGTAACADARVVLVQTGANLGFAGGCNVGMRYALARGDCAYVWLLNNDTVVDPSALARLIERMRERHDAGQCGSTLLYYADPDRVQLRGGAGYGPWLATIQRLGDGESASDLPDVGDVERRLRYVSAASMLVSRTFLDAVGLMNEEYFLYFEELDWACRGRAFGLAYARDSVVYHREGRSIGSNPDGRRTSDLADFYALRNRLLFTRRFFPRAVPTVYCGLFAAVLNRLRRGQFHRARQALAILAGTATPPVPRRPEHPVGSPVPSHDAIGVP